MNLLARLFKKSSCKTAEVYGQQVSVPSRRPSSALSFHAESTASETEEAEQSEIWIPGARVRRQALDEGAAARNSCALAESVLLSPLGQAHEHVPGPSAMNFPRRSRTFNVTTANSAPFRAAMGEDPRLSTASTRSDATGDTSELRSKYRHIHHRYRGSNCDLLEAIAKTSSQPVMIKAFNVSRMTAALRERRQREVDLLQMVAAARVPNVMRFVGTIDDEHQACTIVERSSGVTLIELMANSGGYLSEDCCARQVARPLLEALAGLHALGIIHRHLKPEHLLCSNTSLEIVDFTDAAHRKQHCLNCRVGDLHYMAPEVLSKPRTEDIFHQVLFMGMAEEELPQYDEKADVFSVGVILFEALTGLQPFVAETAKDMQAVQEAKLAKSTGEVPEFIAQQKLSPAAKDFLALAMFTDPNARPGAAGLLQHPWLQELQTAPRRSVTVL